MRYDSPCTVAEELERLDSYLTSQAGLLQVSFDDELDADRYLLPQSLLLTIQTIQQALLTSTEHPLRIDIKVYSYTIKIIVPLQLSVNDMPPVDFSELESLCRAYYNLPLIHQDEQELTVVLPLFY